MPLCQRRHFDCCSLFFLLLFTPERLTQIVFTCSRELQITSHHLELVFVTIKSSASFIVTFFLSSLLFFVLLRQWSLFNFPPNEKKKKKKDPDDETHSSLSRKRRLCSRPIWSEESPRPLSCGAPPLRLQLLQRLLLLEDHVELLFRQLLQVPFLLLVHLPGTSATVGERRISVYKKGI